MAYIFISYFNSSKIDAFEFLPYIFTRFNNLLGKSTIAGQGEKLMDSGMLSLAGRNLRWRGYGRFDLILPVMLTKEVIILKFSTDVVEKVENFRAVEHFRVCRSPNRVVPLPLP
jgi:hypothetical protein